jgi:TonB family protein
MFRQKHIFLLAIVCSLGLHLASFGVYVEYARLRGADRSLTRTTTAQTQPTTAPADELIVYPEMGDDQANGIGSNSSPGAEPMQAREAEQDQALLSRNPQGMGRIDLPPSPKRGPQGNGNGGQPAATPPMVAKVTPAPIPPAPAVAATPTHDLNVQKAAPAPAPARSAAPPTPPRTELAGAPPLPKAVEGEGEPAEKENEKTIDEAKPAVAETVPEMKNEAAPAAQDAPPKALARDAVAFSKPQAAEGDGKQRGAPLAAGNPLPQSESDSDPFSRISGNITVPRVGRLTPRLGRKVKTTRPQVNIAGELDLFALNSPTVVLEVHIAPSGKVTDVKIAHSSGSNAIDEPTRVAVYDWWFEPAKDKSGKPVSDVTFFTVEFL